MTSTDKKSTKVDEFSFAREQFEMLITKLTSETSQSLEHGDVEALIDLEGRETLRRLFQAHLDLRAAHEEKKKVQGKDGIERPHSRRNCHRGLTSLFGDVVVHRRGYSGPGLTHIFPLDAELNLPKDQYSHGLRQKVAEAVAKESFDEACTDITKNTGGKIPKRQLETIAQKVSQDFESYCYQHNDVKEAVGKILVMSCDAKGIVMRPKDLRPATRKAAENETHKLQTRLTRGEKRNRKRMATVAAIYDVAPYERQAEEILNLSEEKPVLNRPRPVNKRLWANVKEGAEATVEQLLREAEKRDPDKKRPWIFLVDGQTAQLAAINRVIKRHGAKVTIIQDFVHVLEYVWKAAYCFYPEGSEKAEKWVQEHALQILKGKISTVAGVMRRSATRRGLSKSKRESVDKCANYLLKNKRRLDYATALKNGWAIATGVIEGGCRYLVKDRMDITGARWSLNGAEAILRLRALHVNGDLENYMRFHNQQEGLRNYEIAA